MKKEFAKVNLINYMNSKGITSEEDLGKATLTIGSSSIPQKLIEELDDEFCDIPFRIESESEFDNVFADNQRIMINASAEKIYFLGVSCQGDYFEDFEVLYDDKHVESISCGFSDFLSIEPYFNDLLAKRFEYSHTANGINKDLKISLWVNCIDVDPLREINELVLPKKFVFAHICNYSF